MIAKNNNIIIEKDRSEELSRSGFILSADLDPARDISKGTIVSVGSGTVNARGRPVPIDPEIQPGIRVCFKDRTVMRNQQRYNPNEYQEDGKTFVNVDISEVLGILE